MIRIKETLSFDILSIKREPILSVVCLLPIILLLILNILLPAIANKLLEFSSIDIMKYREFILIMFLFMVPMSIGMVWGFLLVDERDQGILESIGVTPIGREKYIEDKIVVAVCLSMIMLLPLYIFGTELFRIRDLAILILIALEGPYMILIIASFARDKVEAMAISKVFSLAYIIPLGSMFITSNVRYIFIIFPQFFVLELLDSLGLITYILVYLVAVIYHLTLIKGSLIIFRKRIS